MNTISFTDAKAIVHKVAANLGGAVAVVGSLNADITIETERHPKPGETLIGGPLRLLPGGKSANQAVASGKLGLDVSMVGCLGDDPNANILLESLRAAEVSTEFVCILDDVPTGAAVIIVDSAGENSIVISAGANGHVTPELIENSQEAITNAAVLGLCFEIPVESVRGAARIAKDSAVTTVLNYSPITEVPLDLLDLVDVLIVNEHELAAITKQPVDVSDLANIAKLLAENGLEQVIVTLGPHGSVVFDSGHITRVPAFVVRAVDTTGAGDAFMAAILSSLAAGLSLVEGAVFASAVSALSATRMGAQSSYRSADDVRHFVESYS